MTSYSGFDDSAFPAYWADVKSQASVRLGSDTLGDRSDAKTGDSQRSKLLG